MKNMQISTLTIFAVIVGIGMALSSLTAFAGPHDAGYYACNANNDAQTKYWRYESKKRSDAKETAFKAAVKADAGAGCRKVSYPDKEPKDGKEI